jgi:hypothetical protein
MVPEQPADPPAEGIPPEQKPNTPDTTAAAAPSVLPTAVEYARHGIAVEALEAFLHQQDTVTDLSTTSDVCHAVIRPATVPHGWADIAELLLTDAHGNDIRGRCWYKHSYCRQKGGEAQATAPPGTRSYCQLLLEDPATAHLVGKPTIFFSHAWLYKFANVVAALRALVDGLPPGTPSQYIWFDCFSIDEHVTQALPREWWASTFAEAITFIGHTVMMLSPWHAPLPLTRAWCLWELYCSDSAHTQFSVCLGPAEQTAFEKALLGQAGGVPMIFDAFAGIDVAAAQASNEADKNMILSAAAAVEGGVEHFNHMAVAALRRWVVARVQNVARSWLHQDGDRGEIVKRSSEALCAGQALLELGAHAAAASLGTMAIQGYRAAGDEANAERAEAHIVAALRRQGEFTEARPRAERVVAAAMARYGADAEETLRARLGVATCMHEQGEFAAARHEREVLVMACTRALGGAHAGPSD